MKTIKMILCVFLVLVAVPVYAGELYELEEYLEATTGNNPYDDPPPPVRSPDSPSPSGGDPFVPMNPNDVPTNPVNPDSPTNGDSGSYGNGNFNFFGSDNQSFWTNQENQSQSSNGTQDYLTQAILNRETFVRNRGKRYAKQTPEIFKANVRALPTFSRFFRKVEDQQIAVKKITRTFKIQGTRFDTCFDLSLNGSCHDYSTTLSPVKGLQTTLTALYVVA